LSKNVDSEQTWLFGVASNKTQDDHKEHENEDRGTNSKKINPCFVVNIADRENCTRNEAKLQDDGVNAAKLLKHKKVTAEVNEYLHKRNSCIDMRIFRLAS
jgi:hypothetical protein